MDILSHLPVLAEDSSNPYIFVTSKEALGAASATKRPTSCVMLLPDASKLGKKAAEMIKAAEKIPEKKAALQEYSTLARFTAFVPILNGYHGTEDAYMEVHKDAAALVSVAFSCCMSTPNTVDRMTTSWLCSGYI